MRSPLLPQSALLAYLSNDERQRMETYRKGLTFGLCRGTLRHLLSQYLDTDPQAIALGYAPHGKPYLLPQTELGLEFSLSHSGDQLVCAIGFRRGPLGTDTDQGSSVAGLLGVDIECIKPLGDLDGLIQRCLTPSEQETLTACPNDERAARFFHYWVCKEAYGKAIGIGLGVSFGAIAVDLTAPRFVQLPAASPATWQLHLWQPADSVVAALAYPGSPATVRFHSVTEPML
ncbi:hypothetical protein C7271_25615 [filamentous cyanobacterium CCP5]|nr:hypothetical protein C7271_25615 [filamentous cyanobacterium CCP5]